MIKNKTPYRVAIDMDDTLALFHQEKNALEKFAVKKDFFTNLKPSKLVIALQVAIIEKIINVNDIFIISASPNEQADQDKLKWLGRYLPMIPRQNILLTRLGQNKGEIFINTYHIKNKDLSNYILIDDYTKNLVEWKKFNGKVLKYINEYNNTKKGYLKHDIQTLII